MKHEWKKHEKEIYLPGNKPQLIILPPLKYFRLNGQGNPNDNFFSKYIQTLYTLSYAVKMSPKKGKTPLGYFDYTVYPLEGIWDLTEEAKKSYQGRFNKEDLVFNLMIRQPDFVTKEFANEIAEQNRKKISAELFEKIKFDSIEDGKCIQMIHIGSYDNEPETFKLMEDFCEKNNLERISKKHREIYLSDARKVSPDKLKTVLRFQVK
jgi:hypothetical protein